MNRWLKYPLYVVLAYVLIGILFYFLQDFLFFHPQKLDKNYTFQFKDKFKEISIVATDGQLLNALYFYSKLPQTKGLVVYYHGNADNLQRWGHHSTDFTSRGYDVLLYDYRGFGKTPGKLTENQWFADGKTVFKFAQKRCSNDSLIVYGRSLGTALASEIATQNAVKMLLLETPYTTIANVAHSYLPIYPTQAMSKYHFNNAKSMAHLKSPFHIFHGTADGVVPFAHSIELCHLAKDTALSHLTTINGGAHKNLATFNLYQSTLDSLLR